MQKDQYKNLSNLKLGNNHDTEVATPIFRHLKIAQLCLILCDPMAYTVRGILQARILEWIAFPFSRGSFQPRDQICVSCISYIAGRFFTAELVAQMIKNLSSMQETQETWVPS